MFHTPKTNELQLQIAPLPIDHAVTNEPAERQLSRRSVLGMLGGALAATVAVRVGIDVVAPTSAAAEEDTADSSQPSDSQEPLTPDDRIDYELEIKDLKTQIKEREATIESLEAGTERDKAETTQINKANSPSFLDRAKDFVTTVGPSLGAVGLMFTGIRYLHEKRADRLQREEEGFKAANDTIDATLEAIEQHKIDHPDIPPNYERLARAYAQLKRFTADARFAKRVFEDMAAALRVRATDVKRMAPEEIQNRLNVDRTLVEILTTVAPRLSRKKTKGGRILPSATGIGLNGMRYLRNPLENLNMEGAIMQDFVAITGSLAGSQLRAARLEGSTFGEDSDRPDNTCDLRGTDLSAAFLKDARLVKVRMNARTKLPNGVVGDPRLIIEPNAIVWDDDLSQEEIDARLADLQEVIDEYNRTHPEEKQKQPSIVRSVATAVRKFVGVGE